MSFVMDTKFTASIGNSLKIDNSIHCNPGRYMNTFGREVDTIVLHYTGNSKDLAKNNAQWFHDDNSLVSSAHFFVDEGKTIYQSVDLIDVAWHAGNDAVSRRSFGIEMCCSGDYTVSEATKKNAAYLTVALMKKYNIPIANVIRHYDASGKACPKQMAGENNAEWIAFKKYIQNLYDTSDVKEPTGKASKYRSAYQMLVKHYLRKGYSISSPKIVTIPADAIVHCYGWYGVSASGTKWLYVTYTVHGKTYTGYVRNKKIKKLS